MSHWITMVTAHGPMNGWLAEPDDRPVGGIVLVHEIFGVNADMRRIAERYAAEGYLVVVPALFDKIQREVELGYAPPDDRLGTELASQIGVKTASELVATAADAIAHAGDIGIIGYGWGGMVALHAAKTLALPCVSYYGTYDPSWMSAPASIPMLIHYGELDPQYPPEGWQLLTNGPLGAHVFAYPAGHAFDREGDPLHYQAESSMQAFQRNLEFLRKHIHRVWD